ncbi:MAG: SRPBCC domain-containing protein [Candidatus Hermodarchaeota archaeon]|nr:SRPBCC domain-containing protein [Candidatus Hermodarchaeota archaeon]
MDKVIHCSTRVKCDTQQAFEMFTDNDLLPTWLPNLAEIEPRVGGKYELFWNPNDKKSNSTIGCKVTAIEPNRLIAFEWKGPTEFQGFMNKADPLTHVVVIFVDCSESSEQFTEVHLVHSGWRRSAAWEKARKYFEKAWNHALKKLRAVIREKGQKDSNMAWSYII